MENKMNKSTKIIGGLNILSACDSIDIYAEHDVLGVMIKNDISETGREILEKFGWMEEDFNRWEIFV
jgi:hypothetical protein